MTNPRLYLASQSPRRRELLEQIGVGYSVLAVDIDETRQSGEAALVYVERLAREKAGAGWARVGADGLARLPVLGADTAVVIDGDILGKPADAQAGRAMLARLAGRPHQVLTGVCLWGESGPFAAVSSTEVWFRALSEAEIDGYWAGGEPRDKAGAYGIQGAAALFVERIAGSYSGVVGLPLYETGLLLARYGINPLVNG